MLAVISGPSGAGKSTVVRRVAQRTGAVLSVSATTRRPGPNEVDGRDYYFLSREDFERKVATGEFFEHAEYMGNLYGTPAAPVRDALAAGRDVLLEIEMQGGLQVARTVPDAAMIFILPPNDQVLLERITERARDSHEVIAQRLANAQKEIEQARASGKYRHFVVNDDLDEAVDEVVGVIEASRGTSG